MKLEPLWMASIEGFGVDAGISTRKSRPVATIKKNRSEKTAKEPSA
jgi:hypothetical protein